MADEKKVDHVLSGTGATAYLVLQNLLASTNLKDSDVATIKQKLASQVLPAKTWPAIQQTQK